MILGGGMLRAALSSEFNALRAFDLPGGGTGKLYSLPDL
jgi:hypothetical protein